MNTVGKKNKIKQIWRDAELSSPYKAVCNIILGNMLTAHIDILLSNSPNVNTYHHPCSTQRRWWRQRPRWHRPVDIQNFLFFFSLLFFLVFCFMHVELVLSSSSPYSTQPHRERKNNIYKCSKINTLVEWQQINHSWENFSHSSVKNRNHNACRRFLLLLLLFHLLSLLLSFVHRNVRAGWMCLLIPMCAICVSVKRYCGCCHNNMLRLKCVQHVRRRFAMQFSQQARSHIIGRISA